LDGQQILLGLLTQPSLGNLGYMKYEISEVDITDSIGYGGQSVVFCGKFNNEVHLYYLVKVFHKKNLFDAESVALEWLASNSIKNVPRIIHKSAAHSGSSVLLVSPIAVTVEPKENDGRSDLCVVVTSVS
jgi:hypothetical protein